MPRDSSRQPMDAAASPLPSEDTTPPVTKIYLADIDSPGWKICAAGYSVLSAPFSGEPRPPANRRKQGGPRRRARPIMNGNAPGGKNDLQPGAFCGKGNAVARGNHCVSARQLST